jgi:2-hydroxychromene-2-carboxylate isomerase
MTPSVEFFFDFTSPYGWFAAERIGGLARRHGRVAGGRGREHRHRADGMRDGIESAETKTNLRDRVAQDVRRGIFGSPFIFVDSEAFWGADRLCMVERWLKGGW